jgi:hypothetical protein
MYSVEKITISDLNFTLERDVYIKSSSRMHFIALISLQYHSQQYKSEVIFFHVTDINSSGKMLSVPELKLRGLKVFYGWLTQCIPFLICFALVMVHIQAYAPSN